jgi:hypothetical protein
MRKLLFLFLVITFLSCQKDNNPQCFKVKYIDGICATSIYQIQDPTYFYLGQNNWLCPKDGRYYDHVFVLKNYCQSIALATDSTANVYLYNGDDSNILNCITCLAIYINPPTKSLSIKPCN